MDNIDIKDKSLVFNTDLVEALELHNLMAQSKVTLETISQPEPQYLF